MTAERSVRANHLMHVISRLKQLPDPVRSAVLDSVGDVRHAVRQASLFAWLPIEVQIELMDRIAFVLPRPDALDFMRALVLDGFTRPLIRPLVTAALCRHGRTPRALLLRAPTAFGLMIRNCGELEVEAHDERQLVISAGGLVASMRSSPGIRTFIEGGLAAPLTYLQVNGSVRLAPTPRTPTARYEIRWQAAHADLDPAL